ncbi:hypothetical protein ACWFMI_23675 [Nocardiopsis terrae]
MKAPMLARTPRRGHGQCECHYATEAKKLRRTHKRQMRAADKRAAHRDIQNQRHQEGL